MASGKTVEMRVLSMLFKRRTVEWVPKERDRTLAGKKRIRARRSD